MESQVYNFHFTFFHFKQVQLNLTIKSFLYNTSGAYSKCMFTRGQCSLKMFFPGRNAALLTTPSTEEVTVLSLSNSPSPLSPKQQQYIYITY